MKTQKNLRMEKLAIELVDLLVENDMYTDVTIYVNNEAWSIGYGRTTERKLTPKGNAFFVTNCVNVEKKLEYANGKTVTFTFEGPLYAAINYHDTAHIRSKMDKLFQKYRLYAEQGHAWSMALYPI